MDGWGWGWGTEGWGLGAEGEGFSGGDAGARGTGDRRELSQEACGRSQTWG